MLRHGQEYVALGIEQEDLLARERQTRAALRRLAKLGYDVTLHPLSASSA